MKELRWYQEEAVEKTIDFISSEVGHPLVVLPTGSGKSLVLCEIAYRFLEIDITKDVLVLSHIQEILEQDHKALKEHFPDIEIGLYSAGLGSKQKRKITVAGIQSVHSRPDLFRNVGIVIIDECHLINPSQKGMYRKLLKEIDAVYVGLTATNFRLGHGYIHKGKDSLFTDVVCDMSSIENFNRLVREGYLSRLISKGTKMKMDVNKIKITGGDFNIGALNNAFDRDSITDVAVQEIIMFGKNYKKWLVFAIDTKHAEHISEMFKHYGYNVPCVHSKMTGDRHEVVKDLKEGSIRGVVNVNMLTTGLDVPDIDLIAMLRPTQSPVLHVQTIGRGLRVAEGKDHCLVLDFAGNTKRLGPINNVLVKEKGDKIRAGEAIMKECPGCNVLHPGAVRVCDVCGHEFEFKQYLELTATTTEIVEESTEKWVDVRDVRYAIHTRSGKISSLKVTYSVGLLSFSEYICYDHKGYAKHKANAWVKFRVYPDEPPADLRGLYKISDKLKQPTKILVDTSSKFSNITDYHF